MSTTEGMGFSGHMITVFLYRESCCSAFTITSSDYSNCCNIKPLLSHYTFGHIADTKLISIRTVDSNREKKFYLTVLYSFSSPSLALSLPPYLPPISTQSSTPTPPPFPLLTLRPTHTLLPPVLANHWRLGWLPLRSSGQRVRRYRQAFRDPTSGRRWPSTRGFLSRDWSHRSFGLRAAGGGVRAGGGGSEGGSLTLTLAWPTGGDKTFLSGCPVLLMVLS